MERYLRTSNESSSSASIKIRRIGTICERVGGGPAASRSNVNRRSGRGATAERASAVAPVGDRRCCGQRFDRRNLAVVAVTHQQREGGGARPALGATYEL